MTATRRMVLLTGSLCLLVTGAAASGQRATRAQRELGQRLFAETALGNPGSDFQASCDSCHRTGTDPRGRGQLYYSDGEEVSLLPGYGSAAQETTLRNTPPLMDLELADRVGRDGRFETLEELMAAKLVSRHIGWRRDDRERAIDMLQTSLLNEPTSDYETLFRSAYRVDLETVSTQEAFDVTATALAAYVRLIRSELTAPWDAFSDMNRIAARPGPPAKSRSTTRAASPAASPTRRVACSSSGRLGFSSRRLRGVQDLLPSRGRSLCGQLRLLPRAAFVH